MILIRYIVLLICLPLLGQVSQVGRFSVDYSKGCAPLTINMTEHDGFGNISRQYFYENSNTVTAELTHTYNTPGTYYLVQLVGIDVVPKTDTLVIEVFAPTAPTYNYFYCDGREVQVEIDDETYDSYEVSFANNLPITLQNNQTTSYPFLATDPLKIEVRGVYDNSPNNCAQSIVVLPQIFDNLSAPLVSSVDLVQACENLFHLSVAATVDPDLLYQIEMSRNGGTFTTLYEGFMERPHQIENVTFDQNDNEYCIRVNTRNPCSNDLINGSSQCMTVVTGSVDPVRNLLSTYEGDRVRLSLAPTALGNFLYERSFDNNSFSVLGQGQGDFFNSPYAGRQYFYRVSYQDTCGANWNAKTTRPPFIRADELSTNHYKVTFDSAEHQTGEPFSYRAVITGNAGSEEIPIVGALFEIGLSPNLGEKQILTIIGNSPTYTVQSNSITFKFELIIYVPKAFTPNRDGLNDRLEFFGLGSTTGELKIFTRWGQQIYAEISSAPSWDGMVSGHPADEGIYLYEISLPEIPNHIQKGTFALIKP